MTTAEAATATGRSANRVRQLAARGLIPGATRVVDASGGRLVWSIPAEWAADPANRVQPRGWPKGKPRGDREPGRAGGWPKGKPRGRRVAKDLTQIGA